MKFTAEDGSEWESLNEYSEYEPFTIRRIAQPAQSNAEIAKLAIEEPGTFVPTLRVILDTCDAKIAAATENTREAYLDCVAILGRRIEALEQRLAALEKLTAPMVYGKLAGQS